MPDVLPLRVQSQGFTLIEVLVSLLAGTLLLVSLSWMVGEIRQSWQRDGMMLARATRFADTAERLRALLGSISPRQLATSPRLLGSTTTLTAVIAAPENIAERGWVKLQLSKAVQSDGIALVARIEPLVPEDVAPSEVFGERILASELSDVSFAYLRSTAAGLVREDGWRNPAVSPDAIQIDIVDKDQPHLRSRVIVPVAPAAMAR